MLFSKKPTILLLKRQSLEIYPYHKPSLSLLFPETAVQNQEVVDLEQLAQTITQGLKNQKLPTKESILLLAPSTIYVYTLPIDIEISQARQQLKDKLPILHASAVSWQTPEYLVQVATNHQLLKHTVDYLKQLKFKIPYAAPINALITWTQDQTLTNVEINQIYKHQGKIQKLDLLSEKNLLE